MVPIRSLSPESVQHGEMQTPTPSDSESETEEGPVSGTATPLAPESSAGSSNAASEQAIV